ncbi:hypothetical protein GCM10028808_72150 [Spirosoma migulaei]
MRYGNEWIVPLQPYAKISINETGLYRISYAELVSAGFNLDAINPRNLQLFHHGRELAIEVVGELDNRFDATDFIEFYAEKNKGEQDSLVYYHTTRANPYHSLFSDETFYFFTVGQHAGKRIVTYAAKPTNQNPEEYHLEEQVVSYSEQYSFNNSIGLIPSVQQSYFEEGEGWTGHYIVPDTAARFRLTFENRVKTDEVYPTLEFQLNGRSLNNHQLWYALNEGSPLDTVTFGSFSPQKIELALPESAIKNESVLLKTQTLKAGNYDWYSMTYFKVVYPQSFPLNGQRSKYFTLRPNSMNQSVVQISDLRPDYITYIITDSYNIAKITSQTNQLVVPNTATGQKLFVSNEIKKVAGISVVTFPILNPKEYTYLIVTHNSLLESANQYAAYRASVAGGSYKPLVIETKAIYEQFNFGERSPIAIRRFADYMLSGGSGKYLFLLGRGISFPDVLKTSESEDLVPTFGYPGSDALLTMGLTGLPEFVQALPTGRINVTTNQQTLNYLAKVKEFEQSVPDEWQKRILHLNGGHDKAEITYLKSLMEQLRPIAEGPYMGAQVKTISKKTFEEVEAIDISAEVNEGVSMISYTGHGSSNTLDFNFGYCSSPTSNFHNKGKYPILFFNGCSINNIFYKYDPLSTDWLITPDKGAIAVLAGSFWSYPNSTQQYIYSLYQKLFADSTTLTQTIGEMQQRVNQDLSSQSNDLTLRSDMQQIILQGDPALHLFPLSKPDYVARSLFLQARKIGTSIATNDSLTVNLILANVGRYIAGQTVSVQLKKTYTTNETSVQWVTVQIKSGRDTLVFPIKKELSITQLELTIDSYAVIDELSEGNNVVQIELADWQEIQRNSVYPINALPDQSNPVLSVLIDNRVLKNGDYVSADPTIQINLMDENILPIDNLATIQVSIKQCESCPFVALTPKTGSATSPVSLIATYQLTQLPAGRYELLATGRDAAGNASGNAYRITFRVADASAPTQWKVYPNPGNEVVQFNFLVVGKVPPKEAKLQILNGIGVPVDMYNLIPTIGENTFYWDNLSSQPSGIYTATLQITWDDGRQETLKTKLIKR